MNSVTEQIKNRKSIECSSVEQLAEVLNALREDGILWRTGQCIDEDTLAKAKSLFMHPHRKNGKLVKDNYRAIILARKNNGSYHDSGGENAILCWEGVE